VDEITLSCLRYFGIEFSFSNLCSLNHLMSSLSHINISVHSSVNPSTNRRISNYTLLR
jgi:hypothetical protein